MTITWYWCGNGIFGNFFIDFEQCVIRQDNEEYKLGTKDIPLTKENWNKLLLSMKDKGLSFDVIEEIDGEEGARWRQTTNFSSKGKKLLYQETESEDMSAEIDYDDLPMDELTDYFCQFIEEADEDEGKHYDGKTKPKKSQLNH